MRPLVRAAVLAAVAAAAGCRITDRPTVHEGYAAVAADARLRYRIEGHGADTVLVIHGGPGLHMRYLVDALSPLAAHHTLVFFDQRGRGRSTPVSEQAAPSLATDIDDLDTLIRTLRLGRVSIIAHHWGAASAVLFAKRHPDRVARLVLVSPLFPKISYVFYASTLPRDTVHQARYGRAMAAREDSLHPLGFCRRYWGYLWSPLEVTDARVVDLLASSMCDAPPDQLRRIAWLNHVVAASAPGLRLEDSVASVSAPTLVVQGRGPAGVLQAARVWAIRAPEGRLMVLDGPTLFPWLDRPRDFNDAIDRFLGGGWPAGAWRPRDLADSLPPAANIRVRRNAENASAS